MSDHKSQMPETVILVRTPLNVIRDAFEGTTYIREGVFGAEIEKIRNHAEYLRDWQSKDGAVVVFETAEEILSILDKISKGGK